MIDMNQHTVPSLLCKFAVGAFVLIAAFYLSATSAFAQMPGLPTELEGYAWSGYNNPITGALEGVGWISMSCENEDSCVGGSAPGPKVDYGVAIDAGGDLSGYAWNSNTGWIKFGGLSSFPNTTNGTNAQLVDNAGVIELQGWARACAGTAGGDCSSMADSTVSGGWDGWIALKGTATNGTPYGVRFNNTTVDSTFKYAWGGSTNVGWVDFSGVVASSAPAINTFTAAPTVVTEGATSTITWNVQGFDSCEASNNRGQTDWNGTVASSSGTDHTTDVTPPLGTTAYTLTCYSGGTPYIQDLTIDATVAPAINTFDADPDIVSLGATSTITWNVQGFDSCEVSNNRGQTDWDGAVASASGIDHATDVTQPSGSTAYTLTCYSGGTPYFQDLTVSARTDIEIGPFSYIGVPSADPVTGIYNVVDFNAVVTGVPAGLPPASQPSYTLSVSGANTDSVSGTVDGGTFNPPLRLTNLNFGSNTYLLEVDLPAPGTIPEDVPSTPSIDEDVDGNDRSFTNSLAPVSPIMDIYAVTDRYLVRANDTPEIRWEVSAPYVADCTVQGAGINESFTTPADPAITITGTDNTDPLTSTSVIELSCTEPTTMIEFTEEIRVEVIPVVEEI